MLTTGILTCLQQFFVHFLQAAEDKFHLRQTEVATPGLFSNTEAFQKAVGTTKVSAQDRWAESAAVLSKLVAATTKTAQKPAPKKQQPKGQKKAANQQAGNKTPGGGKKKQPNKSTKGKKSNAKKPSTAEAAAAATKKAKDSSKD